MVMLNFRKSSLFVAALFLVMVCITSFAGAQGSAPAVSLGSVAVGANTTGTVTFAFTGTAAVASVNVLTQGAVNLDYTLNGGAPGTCVAQTYNNGDTCTVGVTFTPLAPGLRTGAVVLAASSGVPLATGLVQGTGTGPQAVGPGVMTKVTGPTAMNIPFELATDASGNLYFGNFNGNSVYKETLTGNTFTQTVVDSSLSHPAGLAVDGAGNVFISDQSNLRIVKETRNVLTGSYTQSVAVTGVGTAYGFAIDGAGNLYAGSNAVIYLETPTGTGSYTQTQILSGFNFVVGLAVDGSGNIFVADAGSGNVYAETLSGGIYTQTVLDTGLNNPNGIAVDPAGNVYVDTNTATGIYKYTPAGGGAYTRSVAASGIGNVNGVAIGPNGTIYASDQSGSYAIYQVVRSNPALTVPGTTDVGSTSAEQTVTLTNVGNTAMTLSGVTPVAPVVAGPSTTCVASGSVPVNGTCVVGVELAPTAHGPSPVTGTDTVAGNFTNFIVSLSGYVTGDPTQVVITGAPAATLTAGGSPGTVTATLEDSTGAVAQFNTSPAVTLTVTNGSGYSATYGPTNATNAVVSFTPAALTASGTYTYTVSSPGLTSATASEVVSGGVATHLGVVAATTATYVGSADSITVNALDVYGNLAAGTSDTVALTATDNTASLPTNFALVGGTASKNVTFNQPGTFTVTATDVTNGAITAATTANIVVQPLPVFTVTVSSDPVTGTAGNCTNQALSGAALDASCSLRDALAAAATANGVATTINFTPSVTLITLGSALPAFTTSTNGLSISGPGQGSLTISGNNLYQPISLPTGTVLSISGLTITAGTTTASGTGAGGGCISNAGTLTLTSVTVTGCSVTGSGVTPSGGGGGIFNSGTLTLTNSSVTNNTVNTNSTSGTLLPGGGITNLLGTMTLTGSSVVGNSVTSNSSSVLPEGGGIYSSGTATLTNTVVLANQSISTASGSAFGGGVYILNDHLTMSGNTIGGTTGCAAAPLCGNKTIVNGVTAGSGGGIYANGSLTVGSSGTTNTVSNNAAGTGGGLMASLGMTLTKFTVSGNTATSTLGGGLNASRGVSLTTSTVSGNTAVTGGGGINFGTGPRGIATTFTGDTISGNIATGTTSTGGGILASAAMTMSSSTVSGNSSGSNGGGMLSTSTTTISNSTFANNSSTNGIGGLDDTFTSTGAVLNNVTIVGNTNNGVASDFGAAKLATGGNNVFGACVSNCPAATTNIVSAVDLSALGNYGGTVQTILPLPGSAAIGGGLTCTTSTDARGFTRATSGACDAGAVQTNYGVTWSAQPAASVAAATNFGASVTLTESGNALVFAGTQTMALPVTLTTNGGGVLSGSPITTLSTAGVGVGTFQVSVAGSANTLTATAAPGVTAVSNNFVVAGGGTTTPVVTVSAAAMVFGASSVGLTASVAYTGGSAPTGSFNFQVDSGAVVAGGCTGSASPLTCTATYSGSGIGAGAHVITGSIGSDTNFNATSGTGTLTVSKGSSAAISWTPGTLIGYATHAVGAGVLNASDATAGTIAYTAAVLPAGSPVAVTAASVLAVGSYTLTANFTPTDSADLNGATASVTFVVMAQNVWLVNADGSLSELTDAGAAAGSGAAAGGAGIAFDASGNIWSANATANTLAEYSKTGAVLNSGFTGGGLSAPAAVAVDGAGAVWVVNGNGSVSKFTNAGVAVSPASGYTGGGLSSPTGVAVDSSGNIWVANGGNNSVTEIVGGGAPVGTLAAGVANGTLGVRP